MRKFLLESLVLLALASICASISNIAAGRERRLNWIGDYPEPLVVPKQPPSESKQPAAPPAAAIPQQSQSVSEEKRAPKTALPEVPASRAFPPHPDAPWVPISSEDAWLLFQKGALILDARRTDDYMKGHITGARSFAVWESDVDRKVQSLLAEGIPTDAPIIVYCSGGSCEDSQMLAKKLFEVGFNNALVYEAGFPDWQAQNRPVETGEGNP